MNKQEQGMEIDKKEAVREDGNGDDLTAAPVDVATDSTQAAMAADITDFADNSHLSKVNRKTKRALTFFAKLAGYGRQGEEWPLHDANNLAWMKASEIVNLDAADQKKSFAQNVEDDSPADTVPLPRPGAFQVYPTGSPARDREDSNDHYSDLDPDESALHLESSLVDDEARQQAIRLAQTMGRQDALRELEATVVKAVPVMATDPTISEPHRRGHKFRSAAIVMCLGFVVVAAIVVPVTVVNLNDKAAGACFQNQSMLQAAVDAYLQSPGNSTYNSLYGPAYGSSISMWCVSKVQIFDNLFNPSRNPQSQFFDADLSGWDVSNATTMAGMFSGAALFSGLGLDKWNVSQVTNMSEAFNGAWSLDANLSGWDVSRVTTMQAMFKHAAVFRGLGVDQWNVSRVNDMESMFDGASLFNADLAHWDVSEVTTMHDMFSMASSFTGTGLDLWNVTHVMDMGGMFYGASTFDVNLSLWDVSNVVDVSWMFSNTTLFRGVGLEHWDVQRVTATDMMFQQATSFNTNLSNWNTSQVETMTYMFMNASSFLGVGLENWNVSHVSSFDSMFWVATKFDANLSGWDVSRVYDFDGMFTDAESFRGTGLEHWNMSNATDIGAMFWGAFKFDANLSTWDVSKVIYMWDTFASTKSFRGIGLEKWDVGNVQDMDNMFYEAELFDADLSGWDVSQVMFFYKAFTGAQRFRGVGVDKWNVSSVELYMDQMFANAPLFDADLSTWQVSKVKNMTHMFYDATSFTGQGLEKWNVSHANVMRGMFEGAVLFNMSLCSWGEVLPSSVKATRMFAGTSCPVTASPNMSQRPPGPFCYPC